MLLLLLPTTCPGLSSDSEQPLNIRADYATLNEKSGLNVYEGNVYLQQGSLVLRGRKMSVQLNENTLDTLVITGAPATYRQRPDGGDFDQQAEAGRIEFYAGEDRIILLHNARAWRPGDKAIHSDRIVFDLKSDTVNAGSNARGERVQTTLPPGSRKDASSGSP